MNNHLLFRIFAIFLVLTQTFSPINLIFRFGHTLKFALFVGVGIALFPSLLSKRSIGACFFYGIVMLTYFLVGNSFFNSIISITTSWLIMMSGLLMTEYAIKYDKNNKFTLAIVVCLFASNVLMALISIPQLLINPDIIRWESHFHEVEGGEMAFIWLMKYQTMHGIPFLIAPLVFLCRRSFPKNKKLSVIWIGTASILLYVVFLSNATTSLLLSLLMLILSMAFNRESFDKKSCTSIIVVGILGLILIQPTTIAVVLGFMQQFMNPSGSGYKRVEEFSYSLTHGMDSDGDMGMRQDLYTSSSNLFLDSPLFGTSTPELISQHSWVFDRLALFGVFFIIPLILLFVFHYKTTYRSLNRTRFVYLLGVSSMLIMLTTKNDFGQGTWLYGFAYLPLLCRYIDYLYVKSFKVKIL